MNALLIAACTLLSVCIPQYPTAQPIYFGTCYGISPEPIGDMWTDKIGLIHCRQTYLDGHYIERIIGFDPPEEKQ